MQGRRAGYATHSLKGCCTTQIRPMQLKCLKDQRLRTPLLKSDIHKSKDKRLPHYSNVGIPRSQHQKVSRSKAAAMILKLGIHKGKKGIHSKKQTQMLAHSSSLAPLNFAPRALGAHTH